MIYPQGKKKVVATTSIHGSSTWKQKMDKVVEEYGDIFTSPARMPQHYEVKQPINLTPGVMLPNGPIYQCSVLDSDEIKS